MCMGLACMCVCKLHAVSAHKDQKRRSSSQERELQMVVNSLCWVLNPGSLEKKLVALTASSPACVHTFMRGLQI